jgi:hypothetical protein
MASDLLRVLFALGAFALPLTFAWFIVWQQGKSKKAPKQRSKAGCGFL